MPLGRALTIAGQIAGAMAAGHRLDIVHRDLKPDNVMVLPPGPAGEVAKVLDFGIAKIKEADRRSLTSDGEAVGTPAYMAPEQLVDQDQVTGSADIYSLGCIFYDTKIMLFRNFPNAFHVSRSAV